MNKKPTAEQLPSILNQTKTDGLVKLASTLPVNHPNFIPDSNKLNASDTSDLHSKTVEFDSKGKPPTGAHGDVTRTRHAVSRSVSHDGGRSDGSDARVKGSLGSFGSNDSKSYEEEVVITYQDEAIDIDEQGAGKISVYDCSLTLYSIYTHFNTLKKKLYENIVEKGEIAQNEQFHLLHIVFNAVCF